MSILDWGYEDRGMKLDATKAMFVQETMPKMAKLYPDEVLQKYWSARLKELPVTRDNEYNMPSGVLVASNRRLLFFSLAGTWNFLGTLEQIKEGDMAMSLWSTVHLDDISSVEVKKGRKKRATLEVWANLKGWKEGYQFSNMCDLDSHTLAMVGPTDTGRLDESLKQMVQARKAYVEAGVRNDDAHLTDFSTLRDQLMRLGIVLKTLKCPNCGGDVEAPLSGMSVVCKYCGSQILASQIKIGK